MMTVSFEGGPYIGLILVLGPLLVALLLAIALAPSRKGVWPLCPPHNLGPMENTLMGWGQRCSKCAGWKWRDDHETAIRLLNEDREERLRRLLEEGQ